MDYSFIDSEGRKFKSAKDVERNLKCDCLLHQFLKKESLEVSSTNTAPSTSKDSSNDQTNPMKNLSHRQRKKKRSTEGLMQSG